MTDKAEILRVLHKNGFEAGYDPHGWRCYHPDRYGPCDCAERCADDLAALMEPETVQGKDVQWWFNAYGTQRRVWAIANNGAEKAEKMLAKVRQLADDLETPGTSFGAAKRLRAILEEKE